ncbi:MAG: hypothetical protein ACLSHC_10145 [Bilophila wadsworthia]
MKLTEDSIETWLRTQRHQHYGTFRLHAFLPSCGHAAGSCRVGSGQAPPPGYSGYSVSKAGLIAPEVRGD